MNIPSTICFGCLCPDRKMTIIEDVLQKQGFFQVIGEISINLNENIPIQLCWECSSLLKRFMHFKYQVKTCFQKLYKVSQLNCSTHLDHCSKIQIHTLYNFNIGTEVLDVNEPKYEIIKREDENPDPEEALHNIENDSSDDDDKLLVDYLEKKSSKLKVSKKRKKKKEIFKEIFLSKDEMEEDRSLLMKNDNYVNAMFKCEKCLITFANSDDLKDHSVLKHELNASKYKCEICECSFASEIAFNYHTNKHRRRYQCTSCQEVFTNKRAVTKHYDIVHCHVTKFGYELLSEIEENSATTDLQSQDDGANPAPYSCNSCDKTFRWKTSLRKHIETHRIETGQQRAPYCEPCRLSFSTTSNLQKHVKTSSKHEIQLKLRKLKETLEEDTDTEKSKAHMEQIKCSVIRARQMFPCAQCDKKFQWRGNLLRHMLSHAARAKGELICKPCNRTFSSIATYKQHMKISKKHVSENDFEYMCSECGKRFANRTRLKDHIDWEHLKNYVHSCSVCNKVFKSHTSLYLHQQVVHKKDGGEHLCDHCGKPFPNRTKLRSHMAALHSGAAPHTCTACGARFSWHSCLARHVRRIHKN